MQSGESSRGVIIGQKGVQYGLIKTGPKKPAKPVSAPKPVNVFGADSDEDDVGTQVARQAEKKRAAAKVQQLYEDALAQDPSVFDYDGVYDTIQQQRTQPKQQEKVERKSRYIAQLKEHTEQRKREQDISFERRQLKERQKEDHLFEDKEKFVTASYRRKLEEDKKWLEQEKLKELEEQKNDVRKIGHMGNFYANLLTKNVAFGTSITATAVVAAGEAVAGTEAAATAPAIAPTAAAAAAAKAVAQLDKYDQLRLEAERALRERKLKEAQAAGAAGPSEGLTESVPAPAAVGISEVQAAEEAEQAGTLAASVSAVSAAPEAPSQEPQQMQAAAQAGKRKADDSAVQAARERYLARKRQQTGS